MKRPQFGLRLMLLVVALIAAIVGWQTAVEHLRRVNRDGERTSLQLTLREFEKQLSEVEDERPYTANKVVLMKTYIANVKKQIDDLSK